MPTESGHTSSFCSHTQYSGRGGNLKKRSATARAGGCQTYRRSCIHWEGHSPRAGAFGTLAVSGMVDFA